MESFIKKIIDSNNITSDFWKDYLNRKQLSFDVMWHHSSGFDLRPLGIVWALGCNESYQHNLYYIGKELKKSEFIFSDSCEFYYDFFLDIWNKKKNGICTKKDFEPVETHCIFWPGRLHSIEPICFLSKDERKKNNIEERQYDGFLLKLGICASPYVTVIFLCLDDEIVAKLFSDYGVNVVAIFENTAGGGEGGALGLEKIYANKSDYKNIKYIFTDNYYYDEEMKNFRLRYDFVNSEYDVKNPFIFLGGVAVFLEYSNEAHQYGQGFCLAIKK